MLSIENLSFAYKKKAIFADLDLTFEENKIIGIVGNNGVGKTTFFRVLCGLYTPHFGTIKYNQRTVEKSNFSFLPTAPFFYSFITGMEYLQITTEKSKDEILSSFVQGLDLPLDQLVESYSTGMQKKLAFSSIYLKDRPILILDEPFNGVDLESNELLKYIIRKKSINKTTLISSHILSTLTDISDEIVYIDEGFHISKYQESTFPELKEKINKKVAQRLDV